MTLPRVAGWVRQFRAASAARGGAGQIIVLFALFLVVLMILAGSAYDYGSIAVDDAELQNAVDAAALAGSNSLSANAALPGSSPVTVAQATTVAYLSLNGVATATPGTNIVIAFPTSTLVAGAPTPVAPLYENITLRVARTHATSFWTLAGISSVNLQGSGNAHAARNMVDIMLSLDTTGSEVISGSFASIQQAVGAFITTMNPSLGNTRGPQIGIARFAGIMCQNDVHGDYVLGCQDDEDVLTPLTSDRSLLLSIANGPSSSPCPVGAAANGGCPLQHVYYNASNRATTTNSGTAGSYWPAFTGTKLPNAFTVLGLSPGSGPYTFLTPYAWSTANNGRNNTTTNSPLNARKVMVLMTDGQNEMYPLPGPGGNENISTYDTNIASMANALQNGPDAQPGTSDDVEVYVVGYFCTPYSPGSTSTPGVWCQSKIADDHLSPHSCPGPVYPPAGITPSAIDNLLQAVSSSSPGTCDHYFPLGKTETLQSLPGLFQALAGRISRGQLTQ